MFGQVNGFSLHTCTWLLLHYFIIQDRDGNLRVAGEEWLVKKIGAYLPGAYEEVVDVVNAYVLTEKVGEGHWSHCISLKNEM